MRFVTALARTPARREGALSALWLDGCDPECRPDRPPACAHRFSADVTDNRQYCATDEPLGRRALCKHDYYRRRVRDVDGGPRGDGGDRRVLRGDRPRWLYFVYADGAARGKAATGAAVGWRNVTRGRIHAALVDE